MRRQPTEALARGLSQLCAEPAVMSRRGRRGLRRWSLLPLAFAAGCTFFTDLRVREAPEGEPTWRIGYGDGCQSGRQAARGHRPEDRQVEKDRFRADDQYRDGWKLGYDDCFARTKKEEAEPPVAPSPAPEPVVATVPAAAAAPVPPAPVPASAPVVAAPPVAAVAPPSPATRRAEIQEQIRTLRGQIEVLEKELETLP